MPDHAKVANKATVELIMENEEKEKDEEEEDVEEGSSTVDLVHKQVPVLQATMYVVTGLWAGDPSVKVAGRGPETCLRALGKASTIPGGLKSPSKINKELACWL